MIATGYAPPAPEQIYAAGRDPQGALRIGAWSRSVPVGILPSTTCTLPRNWHT